MAGHVSGMMMTVGSRSADRQEGVVGAGDEEVVADEGEAAGGDGLGFGELEVGGGVDEADGGLLAVEVLAVGGEVKGVAARSDAVPEGSPVAVGGLDGLAGEGGTVGSDPVGLSPDGAIGLELA